MWVLYNNEKWLLKNSEEVSKQEPYSEYAASLILDKLGIDHVEYRIFEREKNVLSGCPNMLRNDNELVPALYVCRSKRFNHESALDHYIRKCNDFGIKGDLRKQLEQMIVIDYLIANTDRHWNNFGIIRNSKTLNGEKKVHCKGVQYHHSLPFCFPFPCLFFISKENKCVICLLKLWYFFVEWYVLSPKLT
jgi:hypothetical protein